MSDLGARVGATIRDFRRQRNMTLTKLAETVGVSKSLISQIERGTTNPSLTVLRGIARALDTPLFTLFVEEDAQDGLVRRRERQRLRIPDSTVSRELLVPDLHRRMVIVLARFEAGNDGAIAPASHRGEEWVYVLSGALEISLNSRVIAISEGDSYYFDSAAPHTFRNRGDTPAEIIAAMVSTTQFIRPLRERTRPDDRNRPETGWERP